VKAGVPLRVEPEEGRLIHISQAALGEVKNGKGPKRCYLRLKVDGQSYVIGTLSAEERPQVMFDLVLEKAFELSHDWKEGSIHMAGYTADEEEQNVGDDYFDEDSSSDEEMMQVDTPTVVETEKPKKKETEKPKNKENKLVNKKPPSDDEDDEDDSDFSEDGEAAKVSTDKMVAGDEDVSDDEDDSDDDEDDSDDDEDDSDDEVPDLVPQQKKPSTPAPAAKKAKITTNDNSGKAPASSNGKLKDSKSGAQTSSKPNKPSNAQQSKTKKHGRK